jgi:hypothetical protein
MSFRRGTRRNLIQARCHPELVEGYGVKALPACFDRLSMTPFFDFSLSFEMTITLAKAHETFFFHK